jgi:Ran GTPase-activating protein (RanGAP) involved in mRNA processing and transport
MSSSTARPSHFQQRARLKQVYNALSDPQKQRVYNKLKEITGHNFQLSDVPKIIQQNYPRRLYKREIDQLTDYISKQIAPSVRQLFKDKSKTTQAMANITSFLNPQQMKSLAQVSVSTNRTFNQQSVPRIQKIDLSSRKFPKQMIKKLSMFKSLTELNLKDNKINTDEMKQIAPQLSKFKRLKILDLSLNRIADEGLIELTKILPNLRNLETLDLSVNEISDTGFLELVKVLPQLTHLRKLALDVNEMISDQGVKELVKVLPEKLEVLGLGYNDITIQGLRFLAGGFHKLTNLRELSLNGTIITVDAANVLAETLTKLEKLEALNLNSTDLDDDSLQIIANKFNDLKHLNTLDLRFNKIGNDGALALARNMPPKIHSLHLDENIIEEDGIRDLVDVLFPIKRQLKHFDARENKLDKNTETALEWIFGRKVFGPIVP